MRPERKNNDQQKTQRYPKPFFRNQKIGLVPFQPLSAEKKPDSEGKQNRESNREIVDYINPKKREKERNESSQRKRKRVRDNGSQDVIGEKKRS
jgi:hypothetical protein